MNDGKEIDELYVWVVERPGGNEMIATPTVLHDSYPLVTTSRVLAEFRMNELLEAGCPSKLIRFVRAEVL